MYLYNLISKKADKIPLRKSLGSLYVGSLNALDVNYLKSHNINTIISLTPTGFVAPKGVRHYKYKVRDNVKDIKIMKSLLPQIMRTIHIDLSQGLNILVHCHMGIQRAPTVAVKYLEKYHDYSKDTAIELLKVIRPVAFCNGYTFLKR